MHKVIMLIMTLALILCSCDNNALLKMALDMAGDNRCQLDEVLCHYKNDSEKLAAARFLIENMAAHYSYKGDEIHKYYDFAKEVLMSQLTPEQQKDTLLWYCENIIPLAGRRLVSDLKIVTADFLIDNIDNAFYVWKNNPWSRHVGFDDFCEWILPYKVTECQELDNWRDTLQFYFSDAVHNMVYDDEEYNTCFKTLDYVRNEILSKVKPYGVYTDAGYPLLSSSLLHRQTFGRCADYVNLGVLTYRSFGLPAIIDETPFWGRYRAGHEWYVVLGDRGQELPAEWDLGSVPGWQFFPYQRIPKVYRNTYSIDHRRLHYRNTSVYKYKFNICQTDVTENYMKPVDIEIPIKYDIHTGKKIKLAEKYAYIAVFSGRDTDWSIVDFGDVKRGKAFFANMGTDILYIALGFNGERLLPISQPFIIEKDGNVRYIHADLSNTRSIDVHRKYYQSFNVANMRHRILNAKIQYSDKADFSDATTAYLIEDINVPDKIKLPGGVGAHRYWRYLAANGTHGSIAELAFFDDDSVLIAGRAIGCSVSSTDVQSKAFDNDWLSNFETGEDYPDNAWVGMSFDKPQIVRYVRVAPRGDENDIVPGHKYELYWWNDTKDYWHSEGICTAVDNVLHYDNIPAGALIWLRDYTHGWDERPFLLEEGKDIEWR